MPNSTGKILFFLLIFMLLSSIFAPVLAKSINFQDIQEQWATDSIVRGINKDVISGSEDANFRLDEKITRAEFVKTRYGFERQSVDQFAVVVDEESNVITPSGWYLGRRNPSRNRGGESGDDFEFIEATVERDFGGRLLISWKGSNNLETIRIYWSTQPTDIDINGHFLLCAHAAAGSVYIYDPSMYARTYFLLKSSSGARITVAERILPLENVVNCRDLGGYKTIEGKTVKWGMLFRSGELVDLSNYDLNHLHNSGLRTVVDLREDEEVTSQPDTNIPGVTNINLDIWGGDSPELDFEELFSGMPGEYMIDTYKLFANLTCAKEVLSQVFALMEESSDLPLLLHCTAGKDRTGFLTAIILLALGVPQETVKEEYMLSRKYLEEFNKVALGAMKPYLPDDPNTHDLFYSLLDTRPEYLQASFNEIEKEYGSFDAYLEQGLGITSQQIDTLKQLLLE